jgi:hypothetical protein
MSTIRPMSLVFDDSPLLSTGGHISFSQSMWLLMVSLLVTECQRHQIVGSMESNDPYLMIRG